MGGARRLAGRLAGVVAVVLLATATTWSLGRALRPDKVDDGRAFLPGLWHFLRGVVLHQDFGRSTLLGQREVGHLVWVGLPADLVTLGGGIAAGLLAGVVGGTVAALRPRALRSRAIEGVSLLALCTPVFVVGLGLLLLFGAGIARVSLPVGVPLRYVEFRHDPAAWLGAMIAPWIILGLPLAGLTLRLMRGSMLESLDADHLRTARAKGVAPGAVVRRHAVPTALAPTLVLAGASVNATILNLCLVEKVFSIPGAFSHVTDAAGTGDFPLLFGLAALTAALVGVLNLAVDLALAALDPRTR